MSNPERNTESSLPQRPGTHAAKTDDTVVWLDSETTKHSDTRWAEQANKSTQEKPTTSATPGATNETARTSTHPAAKPAAAAAAPTQRPTPATPQQPQNPMTQPAAKPVTPPTPPTPRVATPSTPAPAPAPKAPDVQPQAKRHFELTQETTVTFEGRRLHRIRATQDIPQHDVLAGDLGGWIETTENLADNAWVANDAWVQGTARVYGDALIADDARIYDNAKVYDRAVVRGDAHVLDNAEVYSKAEIYGQANISGNAWVHGQARIAGNAHVYGAAVVEGSAIVSGNAEIYGSAEVSSNAEILNSTHLMYVANIASHPRSITIFRTTTGYGVRVADWEGRIAELLPAVKIWASEHNLQPDEKTQWVNEYKAIEKLFRIRIEAWEDERNRERAENAVEL